MEITANRLVEACGRFWKRGKDREGRPLDLTLLAWRASELGQDLAEYSLLLALIAVVIIVAVTLMGTQVSTLFQEIFTALDPPLPP